MKSIYDFTVTDIDGKSVPLSAYKGKALMVVNVASKCGFTPQHENLQKLYEAYKGRGFFVLGFPANDFLHQEPGTEAAIKQFCALKYHVTFPLFAKISVTGKDIHPLYDYLTSAQTNPKHGGKVTWNFNKFLIDRQGHIVNRFDSRTEPDSAEVKQAVEKALAVF